jgi:outer membrane autotransporter protein
MVTSAGDITAIAGAPHYYVNFDGVQYSQIQANGNTNIPNLSVNLLLAAGAYTQTNTQSLTIINNVPGYPLVAIPTANPIWNTEGVFLDLSRTIPATGTELQLSLNENGNNLNLEVSILQNLYVAITQTSAGGIQDHIGSIFSSIEPQVEAILQSIQGLPADQAATLGNALFSSAERISILNNLGAAGSASVASSTFQAASSMPSINVNTTQTIHNIAAVALDSQDIPIPSNASHSFTASQRQLFTHLGQQLPFLKFQSVYSLMDNPISPTYNNNSVPVATPFEQPKFSLKPVYLSNGINHIWVQPFGGAQRLDSYDQVTGMTLKNGGTAFGVGHRISPNVTLGMLMGVSLNSYTLDRNNGNGTINNHYIGFYGGYAPSEGLNLKGSTMIGQDRYKSQRNITVLSLSANNIHRGWDASGNIEASYKFKYDTSVLSPYVRFGYSKTHQNGYQETNAGVFNLNVPSSNTQTLTTEVGTRFQHSVMLHDTLLQPLIGVSVLREQPIQKQGNAKLSFADSNNNFSIPTPNQMKAYVTSTIGCVALFKNNITLSSLLTGKIKRHERAIELVLKGSYEF